LLIYVKLWRSNLCASWLSTVRRPHLKKTKTRCLDVGRHQWGQRDWCHTGIQTAGHCDSLNTPANNTSSVVIHQHQQILHLRWLGLANLQQTNHCLFITGIRNFLYKMQFTDVHALFFVYLYASRCYGAVFISLE